VATAPASDLSLSTLLPPIQHHVAEYVAGLPNYTCTQTVHRFERPRRVKDFQIIDTIKLEIAILDGTEHFAWPGSMQFEDKDLPDLLGGGHGALTKGDFVMHARNIFLRDQAVFSSPRSEKLGDRSAIRLDYQVPVAKSNFEIRADGQKAVVGYKGTAWVDENSLQLLRISIEAEGIPAKIRVRSLRSEINYAMVQLGDAQVLLPSSSQYTLQHASRVDLSSRIEFSGCRQYAATSNLSFDDAAPAAGTMQNSARPVPLPAGVVLPLRLTAGIDSATAAVGDAITAVITRSVLLVGGVMFPPGTIVHGRIRKMERHFEPSQYFVVGLEFNQLEQGGQRIPFLAEMKNMTPVAGMLKESAVGTPALMRILLSVPRIPGVAAFVVASKTVQISNGHAMTWETREYPSIAPAGRSVAAQR
jgi:hypothetical protein